MGPCLPPRTTTSRDFASLTPRQPPRQRVTTSDMAWTLQVVDQTGTNPDAARFPLRDNQRTFVSVPDSDGRALQLSDALNERNRALAHISRLHKCFPLSGLLTLSSCRRLGREASSSSAYRCRACSPSVQRTCRPQPGTVSRQFQLQSARSHFPAPRRQDFVPRLDQLCIHHPRLEIRRLGSSSQFFCYRRRSPRVHGCPFLQEK